MSRTFLFALGVVSCSASLGQPGTLDPTFDPQAGPNNWVYCMVEQPDGKVIIGGEFTTYNGVARNRIARINTDGSLDLGFDPGSGADGTVSALALQPDGKVLVGGWFNSFNGAAYNRLVRLHASGSTDLTFSVGTGFNSNVEVVRVMDDGGILVGGAFWGYNGSNASRLAKLQSDGQMDIPFMSQIGSAANYTVKHLAVMSNGRVVVAGEFTNWNSWTVGGMVVLHPSGALSTFDVGTGANGAVWTVLPMPDGGLLVGGDFTSWNGIARARLVNLGPSGTLDLNWGTVSGTSSTVRHLFRQADGRIVVVGSFTTLFGVARVRVARLLPDGAVEEAFDPGSGPNLDVETALLVGDDRILIGGNFSSYDGSPRVRLARIKACLPTVVTINDPTLTANEAVGPYQWIDCTTGLPVPGATSQSFTPTENGSYAVITTSNGCTITSDCGTVVTVGVRRREGHDLRVWPIPATTTVQVECPMAGTIELLGCDGTTWSMERAVEGVNQLDVGSMASGLYLLRYTSGKSSTIRTLVVEH